MKEEENYKRIMAEARNNYSEPAAPCMPLEVQTDASAGVTTGMYDSIPQETVVNGGHREKVAPAGQVSAEWFAMVHTPIPMQEANRIPAAREAVEKEWRKLEAKNAWIMDSVREHKDVAAEAIKKGVTVHFGTLMALCHEKHSELMKLIKEYKGRVVFRGGATYATKQVSTQPCRSKGRLLRT